MKRVLSLIVAIVMVALMLPAVFVTSAADDAASATKPNFPYLLKMPEGWTITRDNLAGVSNRLDANGVTLGSAGQYLQMNTKEGVGIGQKRVLTIDFGIDTKIQIMRISWEANAGDAQEYTWHNGSDLDILFFGGPDELTNGEDAKTCIKMCNGTGYNWQNNGRNVNVAVTTMDNGQPVVTNSTIKAWKADTDSNTNFMNVLADGANKGTGTQMLVYFDINENNKITAIHQRYVYHDTQGNFVTDAVISLPIDQENVIVCDGYLTIGHNGWGDNCAMTVKAVSVNAGSYAEMGDSIYSTDFKAWGTANPNAYDYLVPEKNKEYTDSADTYYIDGYLLHYMSFAKVADWAATGYSFVNNTFASGTQTIESGALKIANTGTTDAYMLLTANAIPQAITESTVKYSFRFIGDDNDSLGFIRGLSLNDDGTVKAADVINIEYDGTVENFATTDDAWEDIVTSMSDGEWVDVTVSSVGRHVEYVTVSCGYNSVEFKMDTAKNKAAVDGYMGFVIAAGTTVEISSIMVIAGMDSNIMSYVWPAGVQMGELVQNVSAEAVIDAAKPDYSDIIDVLNGTKAPEVNNPNNGPSDVIDDPDPSQTTAATTTAATTKAAEENKGCKGSIVALPAIIATAIFGCAVVSKKKED